MKICFRAQNPAKMMLQRQSYHTNQTTDTFWRWCTRRGRLKCTVVIKDYHFLELKLAMSYFSGILIDFHPKETVEFTAITAVF